MSKFGDLFAPAVDLFDDNVGDSGTYTAPGGTATSITVVSVDRSATGVTGRATLQVNKDDITSPVVGGRIVVTGTDWKIQNIRDDNVGIWEFDCRSIVQEG